MFKSMKLIALALMVGLLTGCAATKDSTRLRGNQCKNVAASTNAMNRSSGSTAISKSSGAISTNDADSNLIHFDADAGRVIYMGGNLAKNRNIPKAPPQQPLFSQLPTPVIDSIHLDFINEKVGRGSGDIILAYKTQFTVTVKGGTYKTGINFSKCPASLVGNPKIELKSSSHSMVIGLQEPLAETDYSVTFITSSEVKETDFGFIASNIE